MNNIHDYSELRKQIKTEISAAVFQSAKEGIASGLEKAIQKEFEIEAGEIKIDSKQLAKKVSESVQKNLIQGMKKEKVQGLDVSEIISIDLDNLLKEIKEMYDEGADATAKGAKRMIAAMSLADAKGIGKDQIGDVLDKRINELNLYIEDLKTTARMSQATFEEFGASVISVFSDVNTRIDRMVENSITDFDKVNSALTKNIRAEVKAFDEAIKGLDDADFDKAFSSEGKYKDVADRVSQGLLSAKRAIAVLLEQGEKMPELKQLFDTVLDNFISAGGNKNKMMNFWEDFTKQINDGDEALKQLASDLGLLREDGSSLAITSGANNLGGLIGTENIVKARKIIKGISGDDVDYNSLRNLKDLLNDAYDAGANVSRILEVVDDSANGLIMTLEEALPGKDIENLIDGADFNPEFLQASDKAIEKLIDDLRILYDLRAGLDVQSGNIKYDSLTDQFYIFDIDTKSIHEDFSEVMDDLKTFFNWQEDLLKEVGNTADANLVNGFTKRISQVYEASKELVEAAHKGIQEAQDSHSDAKEPQPLGQDYAGGYAVGIEKGKKRVEESAEDIVDAALDATKEAVEDVKPIEAKFVDPKIEEVDDETFEDYDPTSVDEMVHKIEEMAAVEKEVKSISETVTDSFDEDASKLENATNKAKELEEELHKVNDADEEFLTVSGPLPWDFDDDAVSSSMDAIKETAQEVNETVKETVSSVEEISDTVKEMSNLEFAKFLSPSQISANISQKLMSKRKMRSTDKKQELTETIRKIIENADKNAYSEAAYLLMSGAEKEAIKSYDHQSVKDYINKSGQLYVNPQVQGDLGDNFKRLREIMGFSKVTTTDTTKMGWDKYLEGLNEATGQSFASLTELFEFLDSQKEREKKIFEQAYKAGDFDDVTKEIQSFVDSYMKDYSRLNDEQRQILKDRDESLRRQAFGKESLYKEAKRKKAEEISKSEEEVIDKQAQKEQWLNSIYETRIGLKEKSLQAQKEYDDLLAQEQTLIKTQEFYDDQVGKTLTEEQRLSAIEKHDEVLGEAREKYKTIEAIVGRINKQNEKEFPRGLEEQIRKSASMMALFERYKELAGSEYDVNAIGGQKTVDFYSGYYGMTQNKSADVVGQLSEVNQKLYDINEKKKEIFDARPLFVIEQEISDIINKVNEEGKFGSGRKNKLKKLIEEYETKGGTPAVSKTFSEGNLLSADLKQLFEQDYTVEDVADSYKRIAEEAERAKRKMSSKEVIESLKKQKQAQGEIKTEIEKTKEAKQEEIGAQITLDSLQDEKASQEKITEEIKETNAELNTELDRMEAIEKVTNDISKNSDVAPVEKNANAVSLTQPVIQSIEEKNNAFKEEKTVVDSVIDAEKNKLNELKESIQSVTKKVKEKTQAFKEEGETVEKAMSAEKKAADSGSKEKEVDLEAFELKYTKALQDFRNLVKKIPEPLKNLGMSFEGIEGKSQSIKEIADDLQTRVEQINKMPDTVEKGQAMNRLAATVNKYSSVIKSVIESNNMLADSLSLKKVRDSIQDYLSSNTALASEQRNELIRLRDTISQAFDPNGNNVTITNQELKTILGNIEDIKAETRSAGREGQSTLYKVSQQVSHLNEKWVGQLLSFHDIIRYIRTMYTEIKNIDSALIELKKVTDGLTMERLSISLENSFETARKLGSEVTEVINTTADWARLGYGIEDAEKLAEITTLFKNVGDNLTTDTASEYLISTLKGFEMMPEEALGIVDKFNEVANNFAIDTAGIGQALERSSASFNAANTSLSESIALVTTANAVVQNPESVGTTFKTLSARIRGAKTELEELGEEEDDFTKSTSKLRDMVKGMTGFDIMKDEDTFKSIYEILLGIGKEWDKLTDVERASLGEALAGKRNSNVLYAIMNNIEDLEKAYETAENAAGSATKEQENYQKSIQYSVDVLKAEVSELYTKILNSDDVKRFVDLLAQALEYVIKIADKIPTIAVIGTMFGASAFLGNSKRMGSLTIFFEGVIKATGALTKGNAQNAWTTLMDSIVGIQKANLNGNETTPILKTAEALKNPATVASLAKTLGLIVAITAAVYGVAKAIDSAVDSVADVEKRMEDASNKIQEYDSKLKELHARLDEINNLDMTAYSQTQQQNLKNEAEYVAELAHQYENLKKAYEESYAKDRENLWWGEQKEVPLITYLNQLLSGDFKGMMNTNMTTGIYKGDNKIAQYFLNSQNPLSWAIGSFVPKKEDNKSVGLDKTIKEFEKLETKIQSVQDLRKEWLTEANNEDISDWERSGFIKNAEKEEAKLIKLNKERSDALSDILNYQTELMEMQEEYNNKEFITEEDEIALEHINEELDKIELFFDKYGDKPDYGRKLASALGGAEIDSKTLFGMSKEDIANEWIEQLTDEEFQRLKNFDFSGMTISTLEELKEVLKEVKETAEETESSFKNIGALLSQDTKVNFSARYEALEQEYNKELELAKDAGAELDKTLYGNVDLNDRGVLEWNEENLNKYKDAIESWGDSVEDYAGTISTVMGTSAEFDGVEIAFTPMLQTPNGPQLLDKDTVYKYIDTLISQMPEGWTTEDLLKLDAKGVEVDGKKIKGIIAEVGDEAIRVAETMHYLGEDGSLNTLKKEMDEVKESADSWSDVRDDLIALAQSGKLDTETLKSYKYFDEILDALGITANATDEQLQQIIDDINKIANSNIIDRLVKAKSDVDNLNDAYKKYKSGDLIDANSLNSIQDTFAYLGDSYREFEEAVMTGVDDLQPYFDNLVTDYAIQENLLGKVTDETKEWTEQNLINLGVTEKSAKAATKLALENKKQMESGLLAQTQELNNKIMLNEQDRNAIANAQTLDALTAEQIGLVVKETMARDDLDAETRKSTENLALYVVQKELAAGKDLSNPEDFAYLENLINATGVATEAIMGLINAKNASKQIDVIQTQIDAVEKKWEGKTKGYEYAKEMGVLQSQMNKLQSQASQIPSLAEQATKDYRDAWAKQDPNLKIKLNYGGIVEDASSAGSAAAESFKDSLDKILAMYDAELDAGVIAFQTYVDKSRAIIEQYYNEGKITASEYNDYLSELYDKQIKEYDKVINAVQRRIKKEVDALEKQKEEVEESYNLQIEEIQKKIDALQEENDEIDKNMALSKAQYQLARAQHQRTRLMYSESRGFYYEADIQGISDAQEQVRKAQLDKTVSDLQKKITALQEDMKKETDTIDEQIKSLNEYSEAWGEVATTLQRSIEDMRAEEILGKNWEADILSERQGILEEFTNQYVELQNKQKLAYLAAREAEANNPVQAGGSGGGGGKGTTTVPDNGKGNEDPPKTETKTPLKYWYNGKAYDTASQAESAKQADVRKAGEEAYENAMKAHIPDQNAKKKNAEQARKNAEAEINKRQIVAKFSGTDSAQPGETLVGELGSEIVLDKKSGTATIVDSPTIMDMKGGEKVFNAEETEKILKSKYVPLKQFNPKKFAMLHAFANGTSSPMQSAIAAQAVGIASGLNKGLIPTGNTPQTVNQTFNVSLPNITDASRAQDLFKEFESLQRRATQYFSR